MKNASVVRATLAILLPVAALTFVSLTFPGLAQAQDRVLLDYRDKTFRAGEPAIGAAAKAKISTALAPVASDAVKALGKDFAVLGHAKGQLAKDGEVDFYLLSLARSVAAEPFPKTASQVIVALKGDTAAATWVLPAGRQYARLVGAADLDGDRSSEMLLEGSGYNMGQLILSLDAVKLGANSTTSVAQSIPEVYANTCDNPVGAKGRAAKTINVSGGKLVAAVHPEKCG